MPPRPFDPDSDDSESLQEADASFLEEAWNSGRSQKPKRGRAPKKAQRPAKPPRNTDRERVLEMLCQGGGLGVDINEDVVDFMMRHASLFPQLPHHQMAQLVAEAQRLRAEGDDYGAMKAATRAFMHNVKLAYDNLKKISRADADVRGGLRQDIWQTIFFGWCRAIEDYKPEGTEKGVSNFATWSTSWALKYGFELRAAEHQKMPANPAMDRGRIVESRNDLSGHLSRAPINEEVHEHGLRRTAVTLGLVPEKPQSYAFYHLTWAATYMAYKTGVAVTGSNIVGPEEMRRRLHAKVREHDADVLDRAASDSIGPFSWMVAYEKLREYAEKTGEVMPYMEFFVEMSTSAMPWLEKVSGLEPRQLQAAAAKHGCYPLRRIQAMLLHDTNPESLESPSASGEEDGRSKSETVADDAMLVGASEEVESEIRNVARALEQAPRDPSQNGFDLVAVRLHYPQTRPAKPHGPRTKAEIGHLTGRGPDTVATVIDDVVRRAAGEAVVGGKTVVVDPERKKILRQ